MSNSNHNEREEAGGEKVCWQCGATYGPEQEYCTEDGSELVEVTPSETQDLLVGQVFDDRFRVEEKLGEGGMSRVYRAQRIKGGHNVALKILKADFLQDEEIRKRFLYEARVIANLEHPNAIELFDFGQAPDGSFYMVMELLEGRSLAERLDESHLSYHTIFNCLVPVCQVLEEAHQQDIVHRDLKPENIFLADHEGGRIRPTLLDFGIAKHLRSRTMTQDDALWGTPAYMSPEQAEGEDVTAASDIYAMGVMLYELVTGVLPLRAETAMGYAVKHKQRDPQPMRDLPGKAGIPEALDHLVLSMLAKAPDERPESTRSIERMLESIADDVVGPSRLDEVPAEYVDHESLVTPDAEHEAGRESGRFEVDEELMEVETQAMDARAAEAAGEDTSDDGRSTLVGEDPPAYGAGSERRRHLAFGALAVGGLSLLVGGLIWAMQRTEGVDESRAASDPSAGVPKTETIETKASPERPERTQTSSDNETNAARIGRAATYGADVLMRARDVADAIEEAQPATDQPRRVQPSTRSDEEEERETSPEPDASSSGKKEGSEQELEKALETTF